MKLSSKNMLILFAFAAAKVSCTPHAGASDIGAIAGGEGHNDVDKGYTEFNVMTEFFWFAHSLSQGIK